MNPRRTLLAVAAFALAAFDGWWGYDHFFAPNADITFAGLDTFAMVLPKTTQGARQQNGKWDRDPITILLPVDNERRSVSRRVALVSLAPELTYGKAVAVIRDLKNRKICNLLITDNAHSDFAPNLVADNEMQINALWLCGDALGDAGWSGPLPPDRRIHVSPQPR